MIYWTDATIELVAENLHKLYRAANKALFSSEGYTNGGKHDHGWAKCHKKAYFIKRAKIFLKDSSHSWSVV